MLYPMPHGYYGSISADPDKTLMGEIEMGFRYGINVTYIGIYEYSISKPWTSTSALNGPGGRNIRFHFVGSYTSP